MLTHIPCKPRPLLKSYFCVCQYIGATPLSCMCTYICAKSDRLQACIEPCPSVDCSCRPQECYPCTMILNFAVKNMCISMHKAIPTFLKHILVPVNLWHQDMLWMAYTLYNTLQYGPIVVIAGICIATYLQYATSKNSNVCLGFSYLGHIWVTGPSRSAGVTRFQRYCRQSPQTEKSK